MPEYDYECSECEDIIVITRKMTDAEKEYFCTNCKGSVKRIFNSPGAIFKGGGFYSSDKND